MNPKQQRLFATAMAGLCTVCPFSLKAQAVPENVMEMSIEELMQLEVVSVAKSATSILDTAAAPAVHVLTADDIRRSGATSIPDALRLVPGVEVGQIDANKWAVSIRGFNNLYSNKLLVMIDGRSVYSPFFNGTYWDVQDTMLEDIERI